MNKGGSGLRPGVKVVTAHSSKGLEFDYIIIPNVNDDIYPLNPIKVDKDQLDEYLQTDSNVLYVAMTRARENLVMSYVTGVKSRLIDEFKPEHYKEITI